GGPRAGRRRPPRASSPAVLSSAQGSSSIRRRSRSTTPTRARTRAARARPTAPPRREAWVSSPVSWTTQLLSRSHSRRRSSAHCSATSSTSAPRPPSLAATRLSSVTLFSLRAPHRGQLRPGLRDLAALGREHEQTLQRAGQLTDHPFAHHGGEGHRRDDEHPQDAGDGLAQMAYVLRLEQHAGHGEAAGEGEEELLEQLP